tara:strand:+ start:195333 stop:196004 length:672 start_codon:yes stop_codon:yes gene_type:complete
MKGAQAEAAPAEPSVAPLAEIERLHEKVKRHTVLDGATYKIKTPTCSHALYITINDMLLNEGTEHEQRLPFEIFINSKNMDYYQWVSALTLVISAVFRKGGDATFLVDELKDVFDPKGGYFKSGIFMPSIVAEIGHVIEQHMKSIGLIPDDRLDEHQRAFIDAKKRELAANETATTTTETAEASARDAGFPANAAQCGKCHTPAVVMSDGCAVCLSCGDSKCG